MSNIIMPQEDWVDLLDAIREKGGTSALMTSAQAKAAIEAISTGGGGNAVSGTFTPAGDLRSVTLSDCIGKSSILTFPMFDLAAADITTRVHWGSLIVDGRCIMDGSTNTGKTSFVVQTTLTSGTGQLSSRDSFDSSTGTVSILSGADSNYGGYFISGKQYGYVAW